MIGAVLTTLALLVMPNSPTLWIAAGTLWVLDASINVSMEPFRAFVGDQLAPRQRPAGYAMQSFLHRRGCHRRQLSAVHPGPLRRCQHRVRRGSARHCALCVLLRRGGAAGGDHLDGGQHPRIFTAELAGFDDAEPPEHQAAPRSTARLHGRGSPCAWAGCVVGAADRLAARRPDAARAGRPVRRLRPAAGGRARCRPRICWPPSSATCARCRSPCAAWRGAVLLVVRAVRHVDHTTAAVAGTHRFDRSTVGRQRRCQLGGRAVWRLQRLRCAGGGADSADGACDRPALEPPGQPVAGRRRPGLADVHPRPALAATVDGGCGLCLGSILSLPYALLSDSVPASKMGVHGHLQFLHRDPAAGGASALGFALRAWPMAPMVLVLGGCSLRSWPACACCGFRPSEVV